MTPAVEEIRVAERDVIGPHTDKLFDIRDHDILGHNSDPSSVDDGYGAMPALVSAAVTRLDVADLAFRVVQGVNGRNDGRTSMP